MSDILYIQPTKTPHDHAVMTNLSHLKNNYSTPLKFHKKEFSSHTHGSSKRNRRYGLKNKQFEFEKKDFSSQTHGFSKRNRRDSLKTKPYHGAMFAIPAEKTYNHLSMTVFQSTKNRRQVPPKMNINHLPLGGPRVVTPTDGKSKYIPINNGTDKEYSGILETILDHIKALFNSNGGW